MTKLARVFAIFAVLLSGLAAVALDASPAFATTAPTFVQVSKGSQGGSATSYQHAMTGVAAGNTVVFQLIYDTSCSVTAHDTVTSNNFTAVTSATWASSGSWTIATFGYTTTNAQTVVAEADFGCTVSQVYDSMAELHNVLSIDTTAPQTTSGFKSSGSEDHSQTVTLTKANCYTVTYAVTTGTSGGTNWPSPSGRVSILGNDGISRQQVGITPNSFSSYTLTQSTSIAGYWAMQTSAWCGD